MSQACPIRYQKVLRQEEGSVHLCRTFQDRWYYDGISDAVLSAQHELRELESDGSRWVALIADERMPFWLGRPADEHGAEIEEVPSHLALKYPVDFIIEWTSGVPVGGAR